MAISAPVTVAVGGRWQEIEDANHRLSRDLALAEEDAVSHKLALAKAEAALQMADSRNSGLREALEAKAAEAEAFRESLVLSAQALAETSAAASIANEEVSQLTSSCSSSSFECQRLRESLEESMAEASRTMTQLAAKQQDLSLESSQKAEMAAKNLHLESELAMLQSRMTKLKALRLRLCARPFEFMQQVLAAALRAAEILPVEGPNSNPDAVTWALKLFLQVEVPSRHRPASAGRKRSSSLTIKKPVEGAPAVQDARALADLERKLWHAQKARDAKGACTPHLGA
ncbi:hypothetical protein AK812_SmicGene10874 [Symbiodinium microadriaticum]|uniref:Uncharacterized protein n=1 Tax=Symbiodinium microadriaticum TaxID=2951 RepID=A0A1Q9EEL6_SYMMI|nr:hypothetical protein AK812_SmicGene10874 [Symbiodinium microadriaticum]CAE7266060.1 unnamed protein product [Symbiodinium sp. KB8]